MKKTFTLLFALLTLCVSSWATTTTITWNAGNGLTSIGLTEYTNLYWDETYHSYNDGTKTAVIEGVKVTISATVDGSDASFSTYDNSTDLSASNGATLTFSSSLYKIHSIVINYTSSGNATGWTNGANTLTWTGSATHSVEMSNAYVSGITSIVFTVEAVPTTTVTWNAGNGLTSIYITEAENAWGSYTNHDDNKVATIDNVTVTASATTDGSYASLSTYDNSTKINMSGAGTLTFSSASSQFLQIVINFNSASGYVNPPSEWTWDDTHHTVTWSGNATNSVVLADAYIENITSIVFTLAAEEQAPGDPTPAATTITWETADLATIDVEMGYNSTGQSQYIKDIIVTNSTDYAAGQYCHFNTANGKLNDADWPDFSMSNGGSLTFAPAEGKLTRIVITCDDIYPSNLAAGSGWVWDSSSSKLTWSDENGATSVVLAGDGSSTSFSSGPIRLIEFTVDTESATVDPNSVTWNTLMLQTINLYQSSGNSNSNSSTSVEMRGVTASVWAVEGGDYAHFMTTQSDGTNISVSNGGTLTFSSASEEFSSIVINTNNGDGISSGDWTWDSEEATLTWSGGATNSVVFANAHVTHITSIVFTFGSEEPVEPDTREVPELRFYDNLTEATIVQDIHGWNFEPGTDYNPSTSYSVFVKDGVFYYQDQVYDYWKAPSQLEEALPITYSLSNDDVIELTSTSGDEFSFDVKYGGYGDVVVTASTVGNTRFQPASITFTIHVIPGKGAERECVLKFIGGPNAGQFVPEDYKFELETGEEFPWTWFELREKNNTEAVYAPSTTIWGSRNYYVASLNGELKLRALTAGEDMFTVRYSRYPDGDVNGNFQLIEFPVYIKPSKPALVSSLDLSSSPVSSQNVVFNAEYDETSHNAKLAGTLTNEQVKDVMALYAYGTQGWKDALPNTISFELPAGQGSFDVTCAAQDGYEVRVLKFGDATATCFDNTSLQTHTINYNLTTQKAVVIYVAEKSSPNNGPKRAPAAKKDAPLASFSTLAVTPTYSVTAKADPDNAGVYYSTHFNETQKYILPVGTDAYVATISGEDLILTKVANGGDVIPANTALIFKSTSASVVLTPTDDAAITISDPNILHGTDSEKAAPANCYVLSGHSTDNSVTGVGFYQFTGTLAAHKAYATISGGAAYAPKKLRFVFSNEQGATDINNTEAAVKSEKRFENGQLVIIKNGVRYNAQGQIVK